MLYERRARNGVYIVESDSGSPRGTLDRTTEYSRRYWTPRKRLDNPARRCARRAYALLSDDGDARGGGDDKDDKDDDGKDDKDNKDKDIGGPVSSK